jgi:general secretion pathway protein E
MTTTSDLVSNFSSHLRRARALQDAPSLAAALATVTKLSEAQVRAAALEAFGTPSAEKEPLGVVDLELLPLTYCRERAVLPVREAGQLRFLTDDPWDLTLVQRLTDIGGTGPQLVWSSRPEVLARLDAALALAQARRTDGEAPDAADLHASADAPARDISLESIDRAPSASVRRVDQAVLEAWQAGASDIHFETRRDALEVKLRLDGVLIPLARHPGGREAEQVINRIKVLAQLDISETRIPQDGRFRARVAGRELDFRVSIMPSIHGEDAVVRLLDKAQLRQAHGALALDALGLDAASLGLIRRIAGEPHGMLLVTGPTGSGKTTTLYAVLSELNTGFEKIVTIEDPVEYELPGVLQIPVNEKKGLTFARGLRSILRHDPDKILVGEIRDSETAEIAVQASLTGHLVFTTVHANNVYDVVERFTHMGVDLHGFASAVNGIIAQRLLRLNCPHCSEPDPSVLPQLSSHLPEAELQRAHPQRGKGCDRCRGTGYLGRKAIAEVVPMDHPLKQLIVQRAPGLQLREHVAGLGISSLRQAGYRRIAQGLTTIEEVSRVLGSLD